MNINGNYMTPVMPGSVWIYKGKNVMILNSSVIEKNLWEIEIVNTERDWKVIKITMEEWIKEAKLLES